MKPVSEYYAGCTTRVKLAKNTPMAKQRSWHYRRLPKEHKILFGAGFDS